MGCAQWRGHAVVDTSRFRDCVARRVEARVENHEARDPFADELRGLSLTAGMAAEFLEDPLRAVPEDKPWAVGEAPADCVVADGEAREICWPWNLVRDLRTPRASLPGADLVDFCQDGEAALLLFGKEVKTSCDAKPPPAS